MMDEYYDQEAFNIVNEAITLAINKLGLENRFKLVSYFQCSPVRF